MRLIDADALIKELNNSHFPGAPYVDAGISIAIGKVCDAPVIEPERKTGKWIKVNDSCTIRCNQCGQEMTSLCDIQLPNYCLNCGADMRGKRDDI